MIDLLDYMVLPSVTRNLGYGRESHGWEVGGSYGCFDILSGDKITRLKNIEATRWDRNLYDQNVITDWITELQDDNPISNPRNYKKNVGNRPDPNHPGAFLDGVVKFPRFVPDGFIRIETFTPPAQCNSIWYQDCKPVSQHNQHSGIKHVLEGPYPMALAFTLAGKALVTGYTPTYIHQYFWADTLEENWLAKDFGWVNWKEMKLANGIYTLTRESSHRGLTAATVPKVNFPCW